MTFMKFLLFTLLLSTVSLYSQNSPNETASFIGNIIRQHKAAWGPHKGKELYTRKYIDNDMDITLRTLYRIPNKETSIAAFLDYGSGIGEFLNGKYYAGIVFTNKGIHIRGAQVKRFEIASYISYIDIYHNYEFGWTSYYLTMSRKRESVPEMMMNLLYCDIDAPYLANLIESVSEFVSTH